MAEGICVSDIMTRDVVSCVPTTPLTEICSLMKERHFTGLLVMDGAKCCGIVTVGDLAGAFSESRNINSCTAASIMSCSVKFISEDTSLNDAMEEMQDCHLKRMAVSDADNNLTGIVTQTDLVDAALEMMNHYAADLKQEVHERTEELEKLSKLKNDFLGTVAHDLRNPLTVIQMWAELIASQMKENIPENLEDGLPTIMRQSANMLMLINDLLDVTKIESGGVSFNVSPIKLVPLMVEVLQLQGYAAERKGITLKNNVSPETPLINANKQRLRSVLENLVNNAIKYSDRGDIITVYAKTHHGFLQVDVEDTGQGIDETEQANLFAEFSTASSKPTGGEAKTGLGLAIVKKLINHHGGEVWVKSSLNKGSVFSFTVPIVPSA